MSVLRVAWLFLKVSVLNELQYRVNFVVQLFQSLIQVATGLAVLALVYSHTDELNGWSEPELQVVMGIQILLGGLIKMSIQPNMERLMEEVRDGKLDFALTKPEDSQLFVSVREVRIWRAVDIVAGVLVLGYGINGLEAGVDLGDAALFAFTRWWWGFGLRRYSGASA
jgi:ABC-2 type transport system permease protein